MLITTERIDHSNKFSNFYFRLDEKEIILKEKRHLLIFKGYLYPDIPYNIKDILNFFKEFKLNSDFKKFEGRFCGIYINKNENCLFIFNDQLGLSDVFYLFKKGKLIISDKFLNFFKIANFKKEDLDNVALGEFLLYEHVFLDRTFIKNIKLLRYASLRKFNLKKNSTEEKKYWTYRFEENKGFNRKKAMEKLDFLFRKSIKRIHLLNSNKEFLIGLSGGLDSRLETKYAIKEGINLYPFVFDNKNSDAFYISKKIAKILNLPLKQLEIKDNYWKWKNKHMEYDPMMNIMYTSYYSIAKNLNKNKVMLTGFNGDNLFGSHIKKIDFEPNINLINKINSKYMLKVKKKVISKNILNSINKDILKYKQLNYDWKNKELFNFESRQLRFIKNSPSFNFYGDFEDNFSMFSDIDLVEFALSLPSEELFNCKFYHDFMNKYHPELTKIRVERKAYSIIDNKIIKLLKIILLKGKIFLQEGTGIKLPIYKTINFREALDWNYLFKKIDFKREFKKINIPGIISGKIFELNNIDINNIRIKYHYLTIQNFIDKYLK